MKQKVLTPAAYSALFHGIEDNRARYEGRRVWIKDSPKYKDWFHASDIEITSTVKLKEPNGKETFDFDNARKLHTKLKDLSPVVATDPRLWTRLAHVELWDYMKSRWPVEEDKTTRFIRERYFLTRSDSRAIMRNGISRLWWSAQLTYDENGGPHQYDLTEVLLSRLDIAQQLLERNFGRIRPLVRGFLTFVVKNRELCLDDGNTSRQRIRYLASSLHKRSGVCLLDAMGSTDLNRFLAEELDRHESQ